MTDVSRRPIFTSKVCSLYFKYLVATDDHNMASIVDRSPRKVKQMLAGLIHSPEMTASDEAGTSGCVYCLCLTVYLYFVLYRMADNGCLNFT